MIQLTPKKPEDNTLTISLLKSRKPKTRHIIMRDRRTRRQGTRRSRTQAAMRD